MVKGSHMTVEQRERLSVAHIGFYPSLETRAKLSAAHLGTHVSDETRARESIAQMGHPVSDETRLKMSIADMGRTFSPETRAKLSASAKLCRASDETKARMSVAQMGHGVSLATRAKMSEITKTKVGPLSPNWKGGVTPETTRIRTSDLYRCWRTAVFERDNYTCQDCGKHGVYLEAHHIHGFAKYPDERLVVANGVTLCLACHNKTKGIRARLTPEEV